MFPPQIIRVQADGKLYEEMHVDGGTTTQAATTATPAELAACLADPAPPPAPLARGDLERLMKGDPEGRC